VLPRSRVGAAFLDCLPKQAMISATLKLAATTLGHVGLLLNP
jgi:hypothetical protein